MNIFSVNQVNQVYVADKLAENLPSAAGEVKVAATPDGNSIYFQHFGAGGLTRSDLIDVKNILWAKYTTAKDMKKYLNTYVVTLDPEVGLHSGQDYILRLTFDNYVGISPEDSQYWKHAVVHAYDSLSESTFYKKMALSLARSMGREAVKLCTVSLRGTSEIREVTPKTKDTELTGSYNGIIIAEVPSDWILGTKQEKPLRVSVATPGVRRDTDPFALDFSETPWGIVGKSVGTAIPNGRTMADYEYFHLGNRADQYRMVGFPDYIPTKYLVDPTKEYDTIGIHYAYVGSNESCQKSEKDLTLIVESGKATDIIDAINPLIEKSGIQLEGGSSEETQDEEP